MSGSDAAEQNAESPAREAAPSGAGDGPSSSLSPADRLAPPAPPSGPDADDALPLLNQQFTMLNGLRRARTWVDVYLVTGTCLHGQIRSFDSNMLLLQTRSGEVALYHHAVSSVMRAQKRGGSRPSSSARKPARTVGGRPGQRDEGGRPEMDGGTRAHGAGQAPRVWRQPAIETAPRPRVEINREAGGRIEGSRLSASRPAGAAPRRAPPPPAGVVVVRHKRVRTIVKPEDV